MKPIEIITVSLLTVSLLAIVITVRPSEAAIPELTQSTFKSAGITFRGPSEAKFRVPKIHKCKPVKNGLECEIKVSEASAADQAARAAAEALARGRAEKARNDEILRQQQQQRRIQEENARRLEEAARRARTG